MFSLGSPTGREAAAMSSRAFVIVVFFVVVVGTVVFVVVVIAIEGGEYTHALSLAEKPAASPNTRNDASLH